METSKRQRFYDWPATFSRQTGTQGEVCIVVGAKDIGKTFGLRRQCIEDYIKKGNRFVEICRTKAEKKSVVKGYFDKLTSEGLFKRWIFKTTGDEGYIAREPEKGDDGEYVTKPKWECICYFVALTNFQTEKKRTFAKISRFIFDEAIIDSKDRYHRYLQNEYLIFANLLDSISRQQPGGAQYRVYLLGNACDLTCPYFRFSGINQIPDFGYSFWNDRHTLLDYVRPWDVEERQTQTLVGRMLSGLKSESEMIFGNEFTGASQKDICKKSESAKYAYGIKYADSIFGIWMDYGASLCWVTSKLPKHAKNVFSLTKRDMTLDYIALDRSSEYLKLINRFWYAGALRFDHATTREMFLGILQYMGIN